LLVIKLRLGNGWVNRVAETVAMGKPKINPSLQVEDLGRTRDGDSSLGPNAKRNACPVKQAGAR
jgi:hypothetical protein